MQCFTYIFDVNIDDVSKMEVITSSQFQTALNDVIFDWQLHFIPLRGGRLIPSSRSSAVELELKKFSENFSKSFVEVDANVRLVTTSDFEDEEKIDFDEHTFFSTSGKDNGIVQKTQCSLIYGYTEVPEVVKIFPGNVFKIVCKLLIDKTYFDQFDKKLAEESRFFTESAAASKLFTKIAEKSTDDDFISDVTLISIDDEEFKCHRFVLCANSTVFNTMFTNKNFKEGNNFPWKVKIGDIDGDTLIELLRFIYTKDVSDKILRLVEEVLYGSEKYDLQELKSICEQKLKFNVYQENIFHSFEIADRFNLESLMTECSNLFEIYFHLFDESILAEFYAKFPRLVAKNFRLVSKHVQNKDSGVF